MNVFDREILRENVLFVISRFWFGGLRSRDRRLSCCCFDSLPRVVFLSFTTELAILALLELLQKYVQLVAQVFQLFVEFAVSLKGQLQLLRELQDNAIRRSELNVQRGVVLTLPSHFFPEAGCFLVA